MNSETGKREYERLRTYLNPRFFFLTLPTSSPLQAEALAEGVAVTVTTTVLSASLVDETLAEGEGVTVVVVTG
jgi:hypothetical protein